jgi:O-antigen ligase
MSGALLFAPIAMLLGLFKSVAYHDWGYLTYQELGLYFHPTYIATYEAWAFFMLATKWWRGEWLFGKLGLHALSLLVVLVFVALLASKAGFIAMLIAIAFATYDGLKRRAGLARSAVFASLSVVVFAAFIVVTPASLARLDAALPVKQEAPITVGGNPLDPGNLPGAHSSSELRLVTWKTSWNLLLQHPFGVGTGNSTPSMVAAYKDQGEEYAAFRELNAHNQFLQTGVELGWPGILMLCIFLGSGLWYSYRHKQTVIVLFYILLGMNFLFESFLEVQAGIIFTAFIVWLVSAAPTQALQSSAE